MSRAMPDADDLKQAKDVRLLPGTATQSAGDASDAGASRDAEASRVVVPAVVPPRQLFELPQDELDNLAGELGLEARAYRSRQLLVSAVHARRQMISSLDRDALLDVIRWGRRPVVANLTKEQLGQEIVRIKSMRFGGLSQRGLVALARLRNVDVRGDELVPQLIRKLKKKEGIFSRLNRKRRALLGSIVSKVIGESSSSEAYQFIPPAGDGTSPHPGAGAASSASIKEDIEDAGLFGGIAGRIKKSADSYLNQKLDEIEARIDRKLDEIDRRLAEWRDKEIANRIKILKITLWASVIVGAFSLIYTYIKVYFFSH